MKTVIIVLNYNSEKDTIKLVEKIKNYDVLDKIIIVDNFSSNGDFENLKLLENDKIEVIRSKKNGGYSYGNNYGLKYIENLNNEYDYVIISNPDIDIQEDTIKTTLRFLGENDKAALAAPKMFNKEKMSIRRSAWKTRTPGIDMINSTRMTQILLYPFFKMGEYSKEDYQKDVLEVDVISGAFFVIKYDILKKIGLFDENVFLFYEEDILACKIKKLGYKAYSLNNVNFEHFESHTINKVFGYYKKIKKLQISKMYFQKTYNKINKFQYVIFVILNFLRRLELLVEIPIRKLLFLIGVIK